MMVWTNETAAAGGRKRAEKLTPERRKEIGRNAILARWAKRKMKEEQAESDEKETSGISWETAWAVIRSEPECDPWIKAAGLADAILDLLPACGAGYNGHTKPVENLILFLESKAK